MAKKLIIITLAVLLLAPAVLAQGESAVYTAPDESFSFRYPAGWTLSDDGDNLLLRSPEGLIVGVLSPDVVSRVAASLTPAETLDLLLNFTEFPAGAAAEEITVGGYAAARASFRQSDQLEVVAVAVRYSEANTTIVLGVAEAEQLAAVEAVVLAVAASLNAGSTPAEVPAEAVTEATAEPDEPLPEGVLFQDDFEAGLKDWWAVYQGTPSIVLDGGNGALQVGSDEAFYLTTGADWTDYAAEMRVKITQADGISGLVGVRFDREKAGAYAAFFDTEAGSAGLAYFFGSQSFNILSTSRINLAVGQWYDLEVSVQGDQVELRFGGQRTNWLTSTQFKQGTLLLYAAPGAEMLVDDIVIRDLRG